MIRLLGVLVAAGVAVPAWAAFARADMPGECLVAQHQLEHGVPLPRATRAIAAGKLDILVVGAGSSALPGRNGAKSAWPARLENALREALPGVAVKVTTDVKSHRTAAAMLRTLPQALAGAKPALLIWQTGTVDAMQGVDPDRFSDTLEAGIALAQKTGADVILINAQYSPRTESMIALSTYMEDMRWVALQHNVPLFDRLAIMKLWSELNTFDFTDARNKLDTAQRVHDCIGRLMSEVVVEAAKPGRAAD